MNEDAPRSAEVDVEGARDAAGRSRPVHLSWQNVALVAVGGAAGTGLRYLITVLVPPLLGIPVAIFATNVVGAFLLGLLLELLTERGPDVGWSRRLRLGVGTGVLGGFTTYSALATDTFTVAVDHLGRAAGYALATVLVGAVASTAGIVLSRHRLRPALTDRATRS